MKKCSRCKEHLPESAFWKGCTRCKGCEKLRDKVRSTKPSRALVQYRAGARKRRLPFTLTKEDFMALWGQNCLYCGEKIEGIGIDRVDNSKGYTIENVVPCCHRCNMMKWSMTSDDFIEACLKVASNKLCSTPPTRKDGGGWATPHCSSSGGRRASQ